MAKRLRRTRTRRTRRSRNTRQRTRTRRTRRSRRTRRRLRGGMWASDAQSTDEQDFKDLGDIVDFRPTMKLPANIPTQPSGSPPSQGDKPRTRKLEEEEEEPDKVKEAATDFEALYSTKESAPGSFDDLSWWGKPDTWVKPKRGTLPHITSDAEILASEEESPPPTASKQASKTKTPLKKKKKGKKKKGKKKYKVNTQERCKGCKKGIGYCTKPGERGHLPN